MRYQCFLLLKLTIFKCKFFYGYMNIEQWRKCLKLIFQLNVQFKGEGYRWESGMSCTYKVLKFGFMGATKGFYIDWPLGVSAL